MKIFFLLYIFCFLTLLINAYDDRYFENSKVFTLNSDEFDEDTKLGKNHETWFIMFYEKTDDESLELIPKWKNIAAKMPDRVKMGIVDW